MSEPRNTNNARSDALVDAYRQASAHDDARPSPRVRDAVLAHARVVAQSNSGHAAAKSGDLRAMPEAIVIRPAANDRAWYWRAAAGLVLGIAGVWMYRLTTQPAPESAVAAASAPAAASPAASEKAARDGSDGANAAISANTAQPVAASAAAPTPAAAPPAEAQIAVAGATSTDRAAMGGATSAARDTAPATVLPAKRESAEDLMAFNVGRARADNEAGRTKVKADEPVIALAKPAPSAAPAVPAAPPAPPAPAAPVMAARTPQPFPASPAATAPPAEDAVALAELAKRSTAARAAKTEQPAAAATDAATASGVAASGALARNERTEPRAEARAKAVSEQTMAVATAPAAAPAAPAAAAGAAPPPMPAAAAPARIGDMTPPMQQGMANVALFSALRSGQIEAVRSAIARGANVNARDDRGRTPLQIAREGNQTEIVRALEAAGAK